MGYLIVAAYLGFGIYFNYTPGDWVVGAVIWGIVYFSGATDNLSDSHKKAEKDLKKSNKWFDKAIESDSSLLELVDSFKSWALELEQKEKE